MKSPSSLQAIAVVIGLLSRMHSAHAELMVGDQAPKLQVGKWIQDEPVRGFDTNHVYIVEFWATWCGPCVGSIPHLNQVWQKFKDKGVIVIGQDVWDSDDAVALFVKKMGTNMTYRVALDDKSQNPEGFMSSNWWKRKVNNHTIPTAFIINRNDIIAWIGHPADLNEKILEDIVSSHYDLAKAAADYEDKRREDQKISELNHKIYQLHQAIDAVKWNETATVLAEMDAISTKYEDNYAYLRLNVFLGQKRYDDAYKFTSSFCENHPTNVPQQKLLVWTIATSDNVDPRCLNLAEKMAERRVQLTDGKDPAELDTLARVQFRLGKKDEAIATEEKAAGLETEQYKKTALEKTLASYREGKLPKVE